MSPEQLRGDPVDARADVFSLGVMAYEMLTARKPYTGTSMFEIGMQQVEGKVDLSGLKSEMAFVIRQAVSYEKDKRPSSAAALADALKAAL
jgi:serine/threonine-protein kinase